MSNPPIHVNGGGGNRNRRAAYIADFPFKGVSNNRRWILGLGVMLAVGI